LAGQLRLGVILYKISAVTAVLYIYNIKQTKCRLSTKKQQKNDCSLINITPSSSGPTRNRCFYNKKFFEFLYTPEMDKLPRSSKMVCLDGERISVRIALFGLVIENSVRLVVF
jgi:hypothetical protein